MSSKHSIFRTAYHVDHAISDPDLDKMFPLRDGGGAVLQVWTADDLQIMVLRGQDVIEWHVMHNVSDFNYLGVLTKLTPDTKDIGGNSQESWSNKVSPEHVVNFLRDNYPGVPEYMYKLIRTAPQDAIIDWQLMWRDPQPNWTSPLGLVVQVGDSAHTFLPSSGNGAVQGIEDAISVATCLQLGGNLKSGLWSKVHNRLRQV
jgi:2-polyprenyl-6-methoxyphenol hydroxylase-like FAD-dependent oxidoreductase